MTFWATMLIFTLLIPITMIGYGGAFFKAAPKKRNMIFGYRTQMSILNDDTWKFAHHYFGKIWLVCGLILLPVTIILMAFIYNDTNDIVGVAGGIICFFQAVIMMGASVPTDAAFKMQL